MLFFRPSTSTIPLIKLALASPTLQLHILMLSTTATAGLLVLFHVIAIYGALIASLIMTIRQFVSVFCNAVSFGNMTDIPILGWAGVGLTAAGIWIKMDSRYDKTADGKAASEPLLSSRRAHSWMSQYLLPLVACPSTFVLLIAALEFISGVGKSAKVHLDLSQE